MSKKILVVEDNKDNSFLIDKILKHFGYEVVIKETGGDAIEYCSDNSDIDLVLMDVTLPDINGLDVVSQLKSDQKFSKIPFIALTGHSDQAVKIKAKEVGCSHLLEKPYEPSELKKVLEQFIN